MSGSGYYEVSSAVDLGTGVVEGELDDVLPSDDDGAGDQTTLWISVALAGAAAVGIAGCILYRCPPRRRHRGWAII